VLIYPITSLLLQERLQEKFVDGGCGCQGEVDVSSIVEKRESRMIVSYKKAGARREDDRVT